MFSFASVDLSYTKWNWARWHPLNTWLLNNNIMCTCYIESVTTLCSVWYTEDGIIIGSNRLVLYIYIYIPNIHIYIYWKQELCVGNSSVVNCFVVNFHLLTTSVNAKYYYYIYILLVFLYIQLCGSVVFV